ncbi:nucleolar protein 11-like [Anopheles marshallii]|uniref:nucleolar protein 11-like n=1 Tax=Anopheles marshallii TaxID=1521116 RepID=UPI00237A630F|nr:nucleolar protein 11-like [Anopheles marshallii]
MAKLLAYYNLCPINNIEDFLGLSRDVDPGCVINTLGRNIILVVKLSNQRQIRSWTVLDRLSSKVVYDFRSERYVGVFGGRYIRCWNRDQNDINTVKKVKLYRSVLDLFTLSNGQTLLLYTDGSCESLESALETRKQNKLNSNDEESAQSVDSKTHTIRDAQILVLDNGTPLLTYFVRKEEDGSMELNYALLNPADLKTYKGFEKIALQRHGEDIKLVSSCVVDGSDGPSLLSIWSDSRIFNLQLSLGQSPKREEGVGNFIEMVQTINVKQPLSMASIGKDYVAFYANNKNQDGAILVLFNVQFKVFQSKQYFKVYFVSSRFWVVESNILLAFGQTLAVVPFKISKKQLSDMIGSMQTFDLEHTIDDESINEECTLVDMYTFDEVMSANVVNQDTINASKGVYGKQTANAEEPLYKRLYSEYEIDDALRAAYREDLLLDVFECSSLPKDTVQIKLFNNADLTLGPLILSDNYEIALEELERSGYSETEISDRVVPLLVQAHQITDLAKCLKRYSVISERTIVKALTYALSLPVPEFDAVPSVQDGTSKVPPEDESELPNQEIIVEAQASHASHFDLLNVVLSCSFNRKAIIPYIRKELDFPTVVVLLKHLEYLLVDPMATLSETLHNVENFDSDEQVVQWIMVLLDSHYQQFILSTEETVREQLQRMLDIVDRHVGLLNQLQNLSPSLRRALQRKALNSTTDSNQWYNVKSITLY